jgi:hypothetical protein
MIGEAELPCAPVLNRQFTYPTLDRRTREDGVRHYVGDDGMLLPSVTTILSATADKEWVKLWEEWVGVKKADRIRTEATALGTLMHEHLECFLEARDRPRGNNLIRQMAKRMSDVIIRKGLVDVEEVWGVESMLYFPGLYAGTADLIGVYKGAPAIMDFKNAKKLRSEDQIKDYFAQGAAYALAHNYLFDTNINRIAIFMVARDLSYKTFEIEGNEFAKWADEWQRRIGAFFADGE